MEQRLFVDCDDTLILLDDDDGKIHPYAFWRDAPYHANEPLVEFVKAFRRYHYDALIVIWSGGGADYARAVATALFGDLDVAAMRKNQSAFGLVREWDIVVDDQRKCSAERYELRVKAPVLYPDAPEITGECVCGGPSMQPCGSKCKYPLADAPEIAGE